MCVCVYQCVPLVHARYMKADLPELVGPCNIDVWNESNLTEEEFTSKYACIYAYRCTYIQGDSCNI